MKKLRSVVAVLLILIMCFGTACAETTGQPSGSNSSMTFSQAKSNLESHGYQLTEDSDSVNMEALRQQAISQYNLDVTFYGMLTAIKSPDFAIVYELGSPNQASQFAKALNNDKPTEYGNTVVLEKGSLVIMASSQAVVDNVLKTNTQSSTGSNEPTGGKFTVSLSYEGKKFIPNEEIIIEWTDGKSVYTAPLNEEGIAEVDGLDGDYKVTLSKIPEGYIYNPNSNIATNEKKNIKIELYKITETRGNGTGAYDCISLTRPGIFSAKINNVDHVIFYQFTPNQAGVYSVEGWVDTDEDKINPKLDIYNGSSQFKVFSHTLNDGGTEGYYTKNFKYEVKIAPEGVGQAFTFAVKATSKNNEYPINVNFVVQLDGEFSGTGSNGLIAPPMDNLVMAPEYDKSQYTITGPEKLENGNRVFDGDMWQLWDKAEGGDGFYHRYDLELYPETNGYGPILFAYIDVGSRFLDALTMVEAAGNNSLTIYHDSGKTNYKMAIEGFPSLVIDPPSLDLGPYFCPSDCPCYANPKDGYIGICPESCEECTRYCKHLSDEVWERVQNTTLANGGILVCRYDCLDCGSKGCYGNCDCYCDNKIIIPADFLGYSYFANSDGGYPLTEGLKQFLQSFSIQQLLFFDGDGYAETNPSVSVDAKEEDQWLFDCYYYKPKS